MAELPDEQTHAEPSAQATSMWRQTTLTEQLRWTTLTMRTVYVLYRGSSFYHM